MRTASGCQNAFMTSRLLLPVRWLARGLRAFADLNDGDHPAPRKPSAANYIPNSNGEGGKVIASGHPGH